MCLANFSLWFRRMKMSCKTVSITLLTLAAAVLLTVPPQASAALIEDTFTVDDIAVTPAIPGGAVAPVFMAENFEGDDSAYTLTQPGSDPAAAETTAFSPSGNAPRASRSLEVRCPLCHEPLAILADQPLDDLACSACRGRFSLAGDDPEALRRLIDLGIQWYVADAPKRFADSAARAVAP